MAEFLDDRLDSDEPFNARQWAMHGLLSAYFERERDGYEERLDRFLEKAWASSPSPKRQRGALGGTGVPAGEPAPSWLRGPPRRMASRLRPHPWALGITGVAAAILLVASVTWLATGRKEPLTKHLLTIPDFAAVAEAAIAQPLPMTGSIGDPLMLCGLDFGPTSERSSSLLAELLASLNCGGLPDRLEAIEQARRERDQHLAAMESAVQCGDREQAHAYALPLMFVWTRVYRPLRDLGHFDEAIAEIQRAIACASGENPLCEQWPSWQAPILNELALTLEAMGNYEGACRVHRESVELRKAALKAEPGYVGDPDIPDLPPSPHAARQFYGGDLVPPYLRLSWLAVLRGGRAGLPEARQWQAKAELQFSRFFAWVCVANGIPLPPEATLLDAFASSPDEFQRPRAEAYSGLERQLAVRYQGYIPDPSIVAWLRCCLFNAARVSILRGRYGAALAYLQAARASSGARECAFATDLSERPVGPLALAEVEMLHAVALLGAGRDEGVARELIREAIAVRDSMASAFTGEAYTDFLRQFRTWDELAAAAR